MKPCWKDTSRTLSSVTAVILWGGFTNSLIVCIFVPAIRHLPLVLGVLTIMLLCAVIILILLVNICLLRMRKYSVMSDGLVVKDWLRKPVLHEWQDISQIGICKIRYTSRTPYEYDIAVRCVIGQENKGPSEGYGFWQSEIYEALHIKKIVCIRYSEETLSHFQKIYPGEIMDFRCLQKNTYEKDA